MKYVFVASLPKSGTTLVAGLLDRVPNNTGRHEFLGKWPPDQRLPLLQMSWYLGRPFAMPYLRGIREVLETEFATEYFSDVGANLQRAVPYLEEAFEPVAVFHLVRDPREVVRSLYTHRSESGDRQMPILPKDERDVERWLAGDKFTHICMQWAETTRILIDQGARLVRLEQIVSDYEYCRRELLEPAGLELPKTVWREHVSTRVNATPPMLYRFARAKVKRRSYVADALGGYHQWPASRKDELARICGDAMELVGYSTSTPLVRT